MARKLSKDTLLEIVGVKFGRLTIEEYDGHYIKEGTKEKRHYYKCRCECGNIILVRRRLLLNNETKSCGCIVKEGVNRSHNKSNTKIYKTYYNMKGRCYNTKSKDYKDYGERGIRVCDEWLGEDGFSNFHNWATNNKYKEGLSIERVDPNKNYEPSNCKWVTMEEQATNKRRTLKCNVEKTQYVLSTLCKLMGRRYESIRIKFRKGFDGNELFYVTNRVTNKNGVYWNKDGSVWELYDKNRLIKTFDTLEEFTKSI